jgi:hypothetical protein
VNRDLANLSDTKLTQIVVTPYRLIDLLEIQGGDFVLRQTEHGSRYQVSLIHLYRHELQRLGEIIAGLSDRDDREKTVHFYFAQRNGKPGAECSECREFFTDSKGRKGNDCVSKCIAHAKEKHLSTGGSFLPKPAEAA